MPDSVALVERKPADAFPGVLLVKADQREPGLLGGLDKGDAAGVPRLDPLTMHALGDAVEVVAGLFRTPAGGPEALPFPQVHVGGAEGDRRVVRAATAEHPAAAVTDQAIAPFLG